MSRTGECGIDAESLALWAVRALTEKQGRDVSVYDLRGVSDMTDVAILASGASPPQLKAMADHVQQSLKTRGEPSSRRNGDPDSGWIVLDYLDVIIHIFDPPTRAYYAIESLWKDCPCLPLPVE